MANFAVAASPETIERANRVMEMYAKDGDKKEDILRRILDLAESESVRGTHPELESGLRAVDTTICTLIKQINGIVAGQDVQIADLKEKMNIAVEERQTALEQAKKQAEEAQVKADAAEAAMKQAAIDIAAANEKADTECKQALRERDDARTIASEKAASNDLLIRQMSAMENDAAAYKKLQEQYKSLQADYSSLQAELKALKADCKQKAETAKVQAELDRERALVAQERELREEFREQLRQADREVARLQAKLEAFEKK